MSKIVNTLAAVAALTAQLALASARAEEPVALGQFSLSLEVKDIRKSRDFYQKLGFEKVLGDVDRKWLILKNNTNNTVIGLFQDEWKGFKLTFNPTDVRGVQRQLKARGIKFELEAKGDKGPAYAVIKDPDGHEILLDQHN